jgi:uncharacterized Zn ribbon protein
MGRKKQQTEYVLQDDGREVCPECGHLWSDYGAVHYHDCRYFMLEGEVDDDVRSDEDVLTLAQLSLFRPAA